MIYGPSQFVLKVKTRQHQAKLGGWEPPFSCEAEQGRHLPFPTPPRCNQDMFEDRGHVLYL